MLYLDYLAYHNRFAAVSILEKLLLGIGVMTIALSAREPLLLLFIITLMNSIILTAKIPPGYLLRLWLVPAGFLITGLVTVAVSVSMEPFPAVISFTLGLWQVGITTGGMAAAWELFLRSAATLSCLLMIAATTPAAYVAGWLSCFPLLRPVMEIALLTYRFIFVVLHTAGQIYTAQQSRLGYVNWRRSLPAISMLVASIGRKAFLTARDLSVTLAARNYSDRLVYRWPLQTVHKGRLICIICLLAGLAAAGLL